MKALLCLIFCISLFSCHNKPDDGSFPILQVSEREWATFEGTILTDKGQLLDVELSLKEAPVGLESYYSLKAILNDEKYVSTLETEGTYIATRDEITQTFGIQLLVDKSSRKISGTGFFTRNIPKMRGKVTLPDDVITGDLYFSTDGHYQLVLTDKNFNAIAADSRFSLYKRSGLFTIEGYVTVHSNDTSEFFEQNTQDNWMMVPLGTYQTVKAKYSSIATEPDEGVYLRALAYTISGDGTSGEGRDNLVVKEIIEIGSGN